MRDILLQKYNNNEIQITMRLLCHGAIATTNLDDLFTAETRGKDEYAEPLVARDILKEIHIVSQTPSNNAQFITRLDAKLNTPLSSSKLKQLFFFQSNHPIIGNSKHTRALKVNDKGLCAAITSISFNDIHVSEPEPTKFTVLCDREARFHQLKIDKETQEIQQAGVAVEDEKTGQLLAYRLGQKQFCNRHFKITTDCLIPRPNSECLVQAALDTMKDGSRIMDVGTGCGNLLISIMDQAPYQNITGVGIDISEAALAVAKENGDRMIPQRTVEWRQQDMSTLGDDGVVDLLVCNPPYLDAKKVEKRRDHKELVEQEPPEALFAGNEGYQWYHVLKDVADKIVKEDGVVILECGKGMMGDVRGIWSGWAQHAVYKDGQGWDRCLVLKRQIVVPSTLS